MISRMDRSLWLAALVLTLALATGACTNHHYGPKQTVGALGGAALGGFLGSKIGSGKGQLAATGAGVLLGALVGNEIGRSLDDADRLHAQQAQYVASTAPIGQPISWNNPDSGNHGTVTPIREGTQNTTGAYCREYQTTIVVGGEPQSGYGTACQQPDGSWAIAP